MRPTALCLSLALLGSSAALIAQSPSFSSSLVTSSLVAADPASGGAAVQSAAPAGATIKPLSHFALGGGISSAGINLQAATNLNRHLNLRATGSVFQYTINNNSESGLNIDAKLNLASAGASIDFYPFPNHGFRLSPGVLAYNQNAATGTIAVPGGSSFTLDNSTYYSSTANPVKGAATLGLHTQKPAFTITTGWGNIIPRKGGHFSFPFELGVALIGSPAMGVNLTGSACTDASQLYCTDLSSTTDPIAIEIRNNLNAQVAKWKSDLDPLKTYPIVSFGIAYSFRIR